MTEEAEVHEDWMHFNIPESEYDAAKDWLENQSKGSYVMDRSKLCPVADFFNPMMGTLHTVYFTVFLEDDQRDAVLFKLFFADHLTSVQEIIDERTARERVLQTLMTKVFGANGSSGKTNVMQSYLSTFMGKGRGLRETSPVLTYDHEGPPMFTLDSLDLLKPK
jgi:hypothetical protein